MEPGGQGGRGEGIKSDCRNTWSLKSREGEGRGVGQTVGRLGVWRAGSGKEGRGVGQTVGRLGVWRAGRGKEGGR